MPVQFVDFWVVLEGYINYVFKCKLKTKTPIDYPFITYYYSMSLALVLAKTYFQFLACLKNIVSLCNGETHVSPSVVAKTELLASS